MAAIAHFRKILFKPTETFIYNYLKFTPNTSECVFTFREDNKDQFPLDVPVVELYGWSRLAVLYRKIKKRLFNINTVLHFDNKKTHKEIQRRNIQLLHAHFGYTGTQLVTLKKRTDLPLVTTFYGEDISALAKQEKWQAAYRQLFEAGDLFLVEGPFMKKRLIGIGCPPEKASIQRIAIEVDKYPYKAQEAKMNSNIRLLFCGSFREKKGIIEALKAAALARKKFQNFVFYIVGDGPLRKEVEKTIRDLGMASYVKLLGFLQHQEMIELMERSDIFIHPSQTAVNGDSEGGAPTVMLEAQACGLPVISTTHADIPYITNNGASGYLVPERDVNALSEKLIMIFNEPEKWQEFGREGRRHVEENHDIRKEALKLEQKYNDVLQS